MLRRRSITRRVPGKHHHREQLHHSATEYPKMTRLYHRLVSNTSTVSRIPYIFQDCIVHAGPDSNRLGYPHPSLTILERTCVQRAFYRMWTCAVVFQSPDIPQELVINHMPIQNFLSSVSDYGVGNGTKRSNLTQPCLDGTNQRVLLTLITEVACRLRCLSQQRCTSMPGLPSLRVCQCLYRIDSD